MAYDFIALPGRLARRAVFAALFLCAACATPAPPGNVTSKYLSGRLAAEANEVGVAAENYAVAQALQPGSLSVVKRAFLFNVAAGEIDAAGPQAHALALAMEDDNDGLPSVTIATIALKNGDYQAARAALATKAAAPYLRSVSFLMDVWIEDALRGPEAAIEKLVNAPDDVFSGFNPLHNALLADKAGEDGAARAAYQVAVMGLGGPVGRSAYGAFLERSQDEPAALDYYALLRRDSGVSRRLADAGLLRIERDAPSRAYQSASAQQGAAIALYSFAGGVLDQIAQERSRAEAAGFDIGQARYDLPLVLSQLALYLSPDLDEARNLVGLIFSAYGDYDAAAAVFDKIPPRSPFFDEAQTAIARGEAAGGDIARAIAVLKRAIARDPTTNKARITLATLYASQGDHQTAVNVASAAIERLSERPPDDLWRYYLARGGSRLEMGQWAEAEADLKKAVELAPEEATALNYLGYSWAERGVNLDEAFNLIKKAVELEPGSGAITDSLGWAHYQLGNYEEAVIHLEQAASLEPADPTISDHLGDVYWRLGRQIEARYQWRRVLELEPSQKQEQAVTQKLKFGLVDQGAGKKGEVAARRP